MIFKTLFTPAYKSTDVNKRISSIQVLDPKNDKHKSILHELAFNDSEDAVMLAALHKLNSFTLWVKTAEIAYSAKLRKQAQEQVFAQLEDELAVPSKIFINHVTQSKQKPFVDHMLFNSNRLLQHADVILSMLSTIENETLLRRFYVERADLTQQLHIISTINDAKLLSRLLKQTTELEAQNSIKQKLAECEALKDKPLKLKQQATLINSRLLALKEAQDYEYLQLQSSVLSAEFEQLRPQLSILARDDALELAGKYLSLKNVLQQKLSALEKQYNAQQALAKITNELSGLQERCATVYQQTDLLLANTGDNADVQIKILKGAIASANEDLAKIENKPQTPAHRAKAKHIYTQLQQALAKLENLPEFIERTNKAKQVLLDIAQLTQQYADIAVLNKQQVLEVSANLDLLKQQFNEVNQQTNKVDALPGTVTKEFASAVSALRKRTNVYFDNIKKKQHQCEGKLKVVNKLISEGKFKPAISTFYHASTMFEALQNDAGTRLNNTFEATKAEIEKLQDWQAYIAQPRKPQLLQQVQDTAETKIESHFERAELVKRFRQQWSSFGVLHTQEDDALNKAFDIAIEKAFAPCRVFFAQLEKLREQNLEQAQQLVIEVKGIDENTPDSELPAIVEKLKKRFNKIGDIEKSKARTVRRKFNQSIKHLQARVYAMHQECAEQKQKLIEKAASLCLLEDINEAANQAKNLQQQWKSVGFAGRAQETLLWQAFREHNDAIFAKYKNILSERQTANSEALVALDAQMKNMAKTIAASKKQSDLSFYSASYDALLSQVEALDTSLLAKAQQKLATIQRQYENRLQQLEQQKQVQSLEDVFSCLADFKQNDLPSGVNNLPKRYQAWFKRSGKPKLSMLESFNRDELALVSAILLDKPLSEIDLGSQEQRQALQVTLMAHKLQGNEVIEPESVLAAYISLGPLQENELGSLAAMRTMYL